MDDDLVRTLRELAPAATTADFAARRGLVRTLAEIEERARGANSASRRVVRDEVRSFRTLLASHDARDVDALRAAIREGLRADALERALVALAGPIDTDHLGGAPLDDLLELLLGTVGRYDGKPALEVGLIHYDPSPASVVTALREQGYFAAGVRFVDIGSGIGRVTILGSLLGDAEVLGVELDPALVDVAESARQALNSPARHVVADARSFDFRGVTRAFLGAPFLGDVLADVLERLAAVGVPELASWGPATPEIARLPYFRPCDPARVGPFDVARFVSTGGST